MLVAQNYVQSLSGMCRAMPKCLCVENLLTEYNITTASARAEMHQSSKYSLILPSCQLCPWPPCQIQGQLARVLCHTRKCCISTAQPHLRKERLMHAPGQILNLHKLFWSDVVKDGKTAVKFLSFNSSAVSLVIIEEIVLLRACVDWWKASIPGTEKQIYWQTCWTVFCLLYSFPVR